MSRKLKIGFYIQRVATEPGFENVVSAHIQVPVMMMKLLIENGHSVELITTEYSDDLVLPHCVPEGVVVHQVPYGSKQGGELVMHSGHKSGIRVVKLISQIKALVRLSKENGYDCYHFSGGEGIAMIGGLTSYFGCKSPIVLSLNVARLSDKFVPIRKLLWARIAHVITATEYLNKFVSERVKNTTVMKHGIVKKLDVDENLPPENRRRVLFWRDPDKEENGADVALNVFKSLASKYPQYSFDFAVRPHWNKIEGIDEFCALQENANLFTVPYPEGITIEKLISEAVCIVLPFRRLSVNPQLAVMESALAGVPTVTTNIESNPEIFSSRDRPWTVSPGDSDTTTQIVESILEDSKAAFALADKEKSEILENWSWNGVSDEIEKIYFKCLKSL